MIYLLFSGAGNTGKSESIYRITEYLINSKGYSEIYRKPNVKNKFEFHSLIDNSNNLIMIQSYTDLKRHILELRKRWGENSDITHIITAVRNMDDFNRDYFFEMMKIDSSDFVFEIPLGKVIAGKTRESNVKWYLDNIEKISREIVEIKQLNIFIVP